MRQLILARDETHRLSIQLALDAAGVRYRASPNPSLPGYIDERRFWVEEADYDRAREAVLALDDHGPLTGALVTRRFRIFLIVAAAVIFGLWIALWATAKR